MNRITRIIVATVVGFGLSRVMPVKRAVQADSQSPTLHPIVVGALDAAPAFKWSKQNTPYLDSMRARFELDDVTAGAKNDYERVRALSHWTRTRSDRNGSPEARRKDPVGILDEVTAGQQFRCEDYALVLSGVLNAMGMPARVLNLRTADAETRISGAGHVVAEAYLRDAKRWVMVDGQWDMIPFVKGKPASALELKTAIDGKSASISYNSMSGIRAADYSRWIAPYLYYMDAKLDQRVVGATDVRVLMYVPQGGKAIRTFQRKTPLKNVIYTTAPAIFYPRMPMLQAPAAASIRVTARTAG
ncbi:MAG: transglutaminase-like domain-containing protein [Longimicrobiales bacterium]